MKSLNICLDSIDKVKRFVNILAACDGDFDLSSDRYVIDAKSIMGIFSLDLGKTLRLDVHDDNQFDEINEQLKSFLV